MGNESSRPELSDDTSRSLSPLPRDHLFRHQDEDPEGGEDGDDALARYPSSMPATITGASARPRPASPNSPRRRRRTRAPSPESPIHTARSVSSPRRASSPDRVARPATQPDPSDASASRSSPKRKSKDKRERKARYLTDAEKHAWMDEFRARRRRSKAPSPLPESDSDEPMGDSGSAAVQPEDMPPPEAQSPKPTRLRKARKAKGKEPARDAALEDAVPVPHQPTLDSDDDGPPPSAQPRGKRRRRDGGPGARGEEQTPRPPEIGSNGELAAESSHALHVDARQDDINNGDLGPGDDMQVDSGNEAESSRADTRSHVPSPASTPQPREGDEPNINHAHEGAPDPHAAAPTAAPGESSVSAPETRRRSKRKPKRPFPDLQEEQNTKAFAELPLDDAAFLTAPVVAGSPTRTPRARRKKPDKRPDAGADARGSNDEISTGKSQYQSGPLSRAEQLQITSAVDRVRDAEGLSQEDMNRVIHDNPRSSNQAIHRQLWASIQDACPSRPRKKLMSWTRQRFHNFAGRGTWTPAQDDELADLIEKHGKKWSFIAGLINRYQKDVRDRWRNYLVCRHTVKTVPWSKDEEARFRELVESSINQIRQGSDGNTKKDPEALINWLQISEAMSHTRSRLQCMEKWKRIRAADPLPDEVPTVLPQGNSRRLDKARRDLRMLTADDKYVLVCAVRDSEIVTDAEINWRKITDDTFAGRYERQALSVAWGRLRQAVPDWERKTTRDCVLHLCEMFEREGNFGHAEPGEAGGSEDDHVDETVRSVPNPARKGKRINRPSSSHLTPTSTLQQTPVSGETRPKSSGTQRRKRAASAVLPPSGGQVESQETDGGMADQAAAETRVSTSGGTLDRAENEQSPEPSTAGPVPHSPDAEAGPSRVGRHEPRASVDTKGTTGPMGLVEEGETLARLPQHAGGVPSKRWPPGYLARGDDAGDVRSKKRRTTNTQDAGTKAKRIKAITADVEQSSKMGGRSWSVSSSDMDDMEDIPAISARSSYRARQRH